MVQMSNTQNPCWLMIIRRLYENYSTLTYPLHLGTYFIIQERGIQFLTNQDEME